MSSLLDSHSAQPARPSENFACRWAGHMADDVASTFGPTPGAVLEATTEALWLKGNRGDFRIPRLAVTRIGRGGLYPWFFKGIRVRHRLPQLPENIQFLDLDGSTAALLAQLRALGYPVA